MLDFIAAGPNAATNNPKRRSSAELKALCGITNRTLKQIRRALGNSVPGKSKTARRRRTDQINALFGADADDFRAAFESARAVCLALDPSTEQAELEPGTAVPDGGDMAFITAQRTDNPVKQIASRQLRQLCFTADRSLQGIRVSIHAHGGSDQIGAWFEDDADDMRTAYAIVQALCQSLDPSTTVPDLES